MKKLLFVATAALCATVFGAIESTNVVGYQTYDLQKGYNLYSPTFLNVDKSKDLDIQDLKLINAVGDLSEFICPLNADGVAQEPYLWFGGQWVDTNLTPLSNVTIKEGEGFYVYVNATGVKIQSAGSVKLGAMTVPLQVGYNLVGNAMPTDTDIQNIQLDGAAGELGEFICPLDADGVAQEPYLWFGGQWVDTNLAPLVDVTIKGGEGLYIYVATTGVKVVLPQCLSAK